MKLKTYIKTRVCYNKKIIIYDKNINNLIWKAPITRNLKNNTNHGIINKDEQDDNEWLIKQFGNRDIDVIDKETNQVMLLLL
jgi:hypothetical protein